jgi:signal transduction histidine kinase/HAMP domain-containing protein
MRTDIGTGIQNDRVTRGLGTRTLLATALLAVLITAALVSLGLKVLSLRDDSRAERQSEQVLIAVSNLDEVQDEMVAAVNGYLISGDPGSLADWHRALDELPDAEARLVELTAGGPQEADARQLVAHAQRLERSWAAPIMALALHDRVAAGMRARRLTKARREVELRAESERFLKAATATAEARTRKANHSANLVVTFLSLRLVGSILILAGFVAYLLRRIIRPVRRVSQAAEHLAAGDLGSRVSVKGEDEVARLGRSFNEMAEAIERQHGELEEQNRRLDRLATQLRAVLDSTVDGILLTDAEGLVQLTNRPMARFGGEIGLPVEGTATERLLALRSRVRDEPRYVAALERLAAHPEVESVDEFELLEPPRIFIGYTAPVQGEDSKPIGRIWTLREVTEERRLERLKDDFVATVSHELRTPLTSMMGFLEILRDGSAGQLTTEQDRFLAIAYRSSQRLQRLVGDLLFVAQLDEAGIRLESHEVQLDQLLRESVEAASALARAQQVELRTEEAPAAGLMLLGDEERLSQLMANLLSNAIKFTPEGGTVVVSSRVADGNAILEVRDTGPGIPAGDEERIFERFYRSPTAAARATPGTGLGLVIARAIAEAHGGRISVVKEPGQGACFRVELPLATTADRAA